MGRRKLPPLPATALPSKEPTSSSPRIPSSQQNYRSAGLVQRQPTSRGYLPSAPVYYTSYPPELNDNRNGSDAATLTGEQIEGIVSSSSATTNIPQSSKSSYWSYRGDGLRSSSPAIIPGAPFRTAVSTTKQQRYPLASTEDHPTKATQQLFFPQRSTAISTFSSVKTPKKGVTNATERASAETLCQLRFKRELRETLDRRRSALETCEIEAGHRQYMVNRMLISGLMPCRPAELDVPAVVKCTLRPELVEGARIVPHHFPVGLSQTFGGPMREQRPAHQVQRPFPTAPRSATNVCKTDSLSQTEAPPLINGRLASAGAGLGSRKSSSSPIWMRRKPFLPAAHG